jgi:hypothetical protein
MQVLCILQELDAHMHSGFVSAHFEFVPLLNYLLRLSCLCRSQESTPTVYAVFTEAD